MKKANRVIKQLRSIDRQATKYLDIRPKDLILALKEYEVNSVEVLGIDFDDYIWEDKLPTKAVIEDEENYNNSGNSYNWGSDIVFNWDCYKIDGEEYLAVKFHIAGDVRGNYTDYMLLRLDLDSFFEVVLENTQAYFSTSIGKYDVSFGTDALKEGNVFTIEVTDKNGQEVITEYDKYVSDLDTSERNRKQLQKQIRQLFRKGGELHELIAEE